MVSKALDITFLSLRDQSLVIIYFCCLSRTHNLFMSSKHYISSLRHFFTQILKRVTVKAINDIPGENENSSPGGARGHAHATGQGCSRKYQINRESRPTLQCPASPWELPAEPREHFPWHLTAPQNQPHVPLPSTQLVLPSREFRALRMLLLDKWR